jgi:hypothetical protein
LRDHPFARASSVLPLLPHRARVRLSAGTPVSETPAVFTPEAATATCGNPAVARVRASNNLARRLTVCGRRPRRVLVICSFRQSCGRSAEHDCHAEGKFYLGDHYSISMLVEQSVSGRRAPQRLHRRERRATDCRLIRQSWRLFLRERDIVQIGSARQCASGTHALLSPQRADASRATMSRRASGINPPSAQSTR